MAEEKTDKSENYYSTLNCSPLASYEELKQSYQQLIRKYHPDKCDSSEQINFLNIDKAWKTLRDQNLRNEYDAYLQSQVEFNNHLVHVELTKDELNFNEEDVASYPCRCGGSFLIQKSWVGQEDCVIECNECSNCLLVKQ